MDCLTIFELLGDTLYSNNHNSKTVDTFINDSIVGLYFSASWCKPCQTFTPLLIQFYEMIKSKNVGFNVIFISSDNNEDEFRDYLKTMPWPAMNYERRHQKMQLSKLFHVTGIPALVLLDGGNCRIITKEGRVALSADPIGENFPWRPRSLDDIVRTTPLLFPKNSSATTTDLPSDASAALCGNYIGFYFSANYCPPCKRFTPQLAEVYRLVNDRFRAKNNSDNGTTAVCSRFEIVFLSGDKDVVSFETSRGQMPWFSVPFGHRAISELEELFSVDGIPALIIVDPQGRLVTSRARGRVAMDFLGEEFPWFPETIELLTPFSAERVNDAPCLIVFTNGELENVASAKTALASLAEEYFNGSDDQNLYFLIACENEIALKLRSFVGCGDRAPLQILLDMSGRYANAGKARWCTLKSTFQVTEENSRALIKAWEKNDEQLSWHPVAGLVANKLGAISTTDCAANLPSTTHEDDEKENTAV